MQRPFAHRSSWLLAALACLSMAGAGCASSSDQQKTETKQQASSSSNASEPDRSAESPGSETETAGSAQSESTPTRSDSTTSPTPAGQETSRSDNEPKKKISDEKLRQFGAISQKMKRIQVETRRKIESAESRQEARKIQQKAQRRVQKVLEDAPMTPREYETIARRLQEDPELQQRLRKQMQSP